MAGAVTGYLAGALVLLLVDDIDVEVEASPDSGRLAACAAMAACAAATPFCANVTAAVGGASTPLRARAPLRTPDAPLPGLIPPPLISEEAPPVPPPVPPRPPPSPSSGSYKQMRALTKS